MITNWLNRNHDRKTHDGSGQFSSFDWDSPPASPVLDCALTRTCQTFSLTPWELQKRMLTPTRPWPPHTVLGVMTVSRTARVLLLYSLMVTGRSTFRLSRSFRVSLSWFWQGRPLQGYQGGRNTQDMCRSRGPTSLVPPTERMKSKYGSSPAWWPGEFSWTFRWCLWSTSGQNV